jgi:hypothetical protein
MLAPLRSGVRPGADLALAKRQTSLDIRESMARDEPRDFRQGLSHFHRQAGARGSGAFRESWESVSEARPVLSGRIVVFSPARSCSRQWCISGIMGIGFRGAAGTFGKDGRVFTALLRTADGNFAHYAKRSQSESRYFREGWQRFAAVLGIVEPSFAHYATPAQSGARQFREELSRFAEGLRVDPAALAGLSGIGFRADQRRKGERLHVRGRPAGRLSCAKRHGVRRRCAALRAQDWFANHSRRRPECGSQSGAAAHAFPVRQAEGLRRLSPPPRPSAAFGVQRRCSADLWTKDRAAPPT